MNIFAQKKIKLLLTIFAVSLLLSAFNLSLKLFVTPAWFNGILENNHKLLLDFNFTNNEQSRLFQFLVPEFFIQILNIDIIQAYILQRYLFTTLTFFLFFIFCQKWFSTIQSFICIVLLALIIPITYRNDLQESASLLMLTFLCSLWSIREKKDLLFMILLLIGSINNETSLYLPSVYFFFNFSSKKLLPKLVAKTTLIAIPAYIAVGIIRYINIDRPHLGGALHFTDNLHNIGSLIVVFHVFWVLPFLFFKKQDDFLKRSLLTIPLFIIPHLITGIIEETRQMLPLAFVIIPASLFSMLEIKRLYQNRSKV